MIFCKMSKDKISDTCTNILQLDYKILDILNGSLWSLYYVSTCSISYQRAWQWLKVDIKCKTLGICQIAKIILTVLKIYNIILFDIENISENR